METFQIQPENCLLSKTKKYLMNSFSTKLRPKLLYHTASSQQLRALCTSSSLNLSSSSSTTTTTKQELIIHEPTTTKKNVLRTNTNSVRAKVKLSDSQLKENWLASLSCPFPEKKTVFSSYDIDGDTKPPPPPPPRSSNVVVPEFVIGIDPDLSGALAVLKTDDDSGFTAQVFDSPHLQVLIGRRVRRRLDANSIVKLLQSFHAPIGTIAYLEQSTPYPQDGKQGWWSGGFGYGLWIGVLVASGFSVVPVPSCTWKNEFELSGNHSNKDDSRRVASTLFPSMSSLLKRKKDHGRAEALLIAAYGKGLKMKSQSLCISQELVP